MTATPRPEPSSPNIGRLHIAEKAAWSMNGFLALLIGLVVILAAVLVAINDATAHGENGSAGGILGVIALVVAGIIVFSSLTIITPGTTKVIQFFGRYIGTVRTPGLRLTLPLTTRKRVSVRVANFETNELKVNDADGNPINIAAIVVWQVSDTAKAVFGIEDYTDFVRVQAESALRHVAMAHPYDHADAGEITLRGEPERVSTEIAQEVAARVAIAGIEVLEARISNLAYAPEIAQAMLQRQQASAIIAARELIVQGAVGMVEKALADLERDSVVALDEERKAAMVSNLLVVLCGDSRATPVVNAGTLYS